MKREAKYGTHETNFRNTKWDEVLIDGVAAGFVTTRTAGLLRPFRQTAVYLVGKGREGLFLGRSDCRLVEGDDVFEDGTPCYEARTDLPPDATEEEGLEAVLRLYEVEHGGKEGRQ